MMVYSWFTLQLQLIELLDLDIANLYRIQE
jgi:hypothetical protein